ncbi:MAG TPA: hypothetical protein VJL83_01480 [Patescibacteria group bacterium]|nr:hypothetical protein [Patescibacteria group bacterium]
MQTKKLIVTHSNPDLDAVTSIWLIKRFWSEWENAELYFVPAGETLESFARKSNNRKLINQFRNYEIIHVDTGMGEFDHHQDNKDTCAAKLIFDQLADDIELTTNGRTSKIDVKRFHKEALGRLVRVVNDIDHFRQVYFPDPTADRHQFMLVDILDGLNLLYNETGNGDIQVVDHGMVALDAIYRVLQNKANAENEIASGDKLTVKTRYGKAAGFTTGNDAVLDMAQKMGYVIVVRKDPKKSYVRIKSLPEKGIDLTPVYETLKHDDPQATWFLHSSKSMVLNGSTKNPTMKPSRLGIQEIMQIIKKI